MNITKYNTMLEGTKLTLVKEKTTRYPAQSLNNPDAIIDCMNEVFNLNKMSEEYIYLLCFNTKLSLQGVFEVSHGTVNMSITDPSIIFKKALLCNAASIAIIHNHPSGDCTPSQQDIEITDRIQKAGELLNIQLIDHLIVGNPGYFSLKETGYIK